VNTIMYTELGELITLYAFRSKALLTGMVKGEIRRPYGACTTNSLTSARLGSSTPAIKAANGTVATTIEEKEAVFFKSAFPGPIEGLTENPPISIQPISDNIAIRYIDIEEALFNQSTKKASGPNRLNFKALRLLWQWDKNRVKALVTQCFR
jgi:hypothetical protein